MRRFVFMSALMVLVFGTSDIFSTDRKVTLNPRGCLTKPMVSAEGSPSAQEAWSLMSGACTTLVYNGPSETKLDIVFVPSHWYLDTGPGSKWRSDVDLMIQWLTDFPQYGNNISRINIHRLDYTTPNDGCLITNDNIVCDRDSLIAIASLCLGYDLAHNDQIILLVDTVAVFSRADPEYGTTYMYAGHYPYLPHEFGHGFGKLGDEYDSPYTATVPPPYPNCASDDPGYTCNDKWGDLIGQMGVGCFLGAGQANWYRPTENDCAMRSMTLDHYCLVCSLHVDSMLSIYDDITATRPPIYDPEIILSQNTPNPFNPSTSITFSVPEPMHVSLDVYDVKGRHLVTLFDDIAIQGITERFWNGVDKDGTPAPSGVYFCRLVAGEAVNTKKMVLLK
jgi:hypothetical protein